MSTAPGSDQIFPAPAPHERQSITAADGTRLAVQVFGPPDAPTVVLAHGWTCAVRFWNRQLGPLAHQWRVVAFDQRGHGDSSAPGSAGFTPRALADDLSAVLHACVPAGEQAVLAGHSMGAMGMIAFGERHREQLRAQVAAAVLISTGMQGLMARSRVVPMPLPLGRLMTPVSARVIAAGPRRGQLTPGLLAMTRYASMSRTATAQEVRFAAEVIASCPPRTRARFAFMLADLDLSAQVRNFDVPALVVAGGRDKLTPLWHARQLQATLPRPIGLLEFPTAGHLTPLQEPVAVTAAIADTAGSHLPARTGPERVVDLAPTQESSDARPA